MNEFTMLTVDNKHLSVEKQYREDDPTGKIEYRFSNKCGEPVRVTLVESVPESVDLENVGVVPRSKEHWEKGDQSLTFEREITDGELITAITCRAGFEDDLKSWLSEPKITTTVIHDDSAGEVTEHDTTDGATPAGTTQSKSDSASSKSPPKGSEVFSAGQSEGDSATESVESDEIGASSNADYSDSEPEETEGKEIGTSSRETPHTDAAESAVKDTNGEKVMSENSEPTQSQHSEQEQSEADEADDRAQADGSASGASIVSRESANNDMGLQLLESLDNIRESVESVNQDGKFEARLTKLESEVSNLLSYTDALEEFLSDNGTGQQIIESTKNDISVIRKELRKLDQKAGTNSSAINDLELTITTIENKLEEASSEQEAIESTLEQHEDSIESLASDIEGLDQNIDGNYNELESRVDENAESIESHESEIASNTSDIAENNSAIEENASEIKANAERIEEVDSDTEIIDRYDEKIESLSNQLENNSVRCGRNTSDISDNEEAIEANSELVSENEDTISEVEQRVSDNEKNIADASSTIESLSSSLSDLSEEVEAGATEREELSADMQNYADELETLSNQVSNIEEELAELSEQLGNSGQVDERLDNIEDDLSDVLKWRDKITSGLLSAE